MEIIFVTGNKAKIRVLEDILQDYNISVKQKNLSFNEIQDVDVKKVAVDKAKQVINRVQEAYIVDDSGLHIHALNGFPGALMKPILNTIKDNGICKLMDKKTDRTAVFTNVFVIVEPKTREISTFTVFQKGTIAKLPKGSTNIGWGIEQIFIPEDSEKTIAEYSDAEWNKYWSSLKNSGQYKSFAEWVKKNLEK